MERVRVTEELLEQHVVDGRRRVDVGAPAAPGMAEARPVERPLEADDVPADPPRLATARIGRPVRGLLKRRSPNAW